MSSKITHLPPGLAHGAPQTKTEPRTQGRGPARTGPKNRATAQAQHGEDELFHQDLHEGTGEGRSKDTGHDQTAGGGNKAFQGPTPPQRGTGSAVGASGVSLGQGRAPTGAGTPAGQATQGRRADQARWAQLLQGVPQDRLAAGQAALKQHEAALLAFASKVGQLRRGR